jgi:hypothetical protein
MGFADQYLGKQKRVTPYFTDLPSGKLRFSVVIPAYCEPHLSDALQSLWDCKRPRDPVEVIVVVNSPIDASLQVTETNRATLLTTSEWICDHNDPAMRFLLMDQTSLPDHDAGVGLVRKTGMDEALFRFNLVNNPHGYILSFDADSRCDDNYFTAIEAAIDLHPLAKGFDVYFEHPLSGPGYPEKVYRGIAAYELHLRYLNLFLRFTGFPFAHHTIGSCFGTRADVYAAQGGMNKRKAGEDFYFLHKVIPLGNFITIKDTRVVPSPRTSDRVPFGTGVSIGKFLSADDEITLTYAPECFLTLLPFFQLIEKLFKMPSPEVGLTLGSMPEPLKSHLSELGAVPAIANINSNCSSLPAFTNRFFRWFDAFRIVKYLNASHRSYFRMIPVQEAAIRFLDIAGSQPHPGAVNTFDLLKIFRDIERGKF